MNSRSLRRSRAHRRGTRLLIFFVGLIALGIVASCAAKAPSGGAPSAKAVALRDAMDKLWNDHITFTRLFIVDAAAGLPETQATTERLLRNQDDIGNAVASYYGPDAGAKLTALLRTHITTAGELVLASKANDTAKANDAQTRWFANADSIATFLSAANASNWPEADM